MFYAAFLKDFGKKAPSLLSNVARAKAPIIAEKLRLARTRNPVAAIVIVGERQVSPMMKEATLANQVARRIFHPFDSIAPLNFLEAIKATVRRGLK